MRNDLPSMNPGRAMAQASHASNAFIHRHGKKKEVIEWQKQTTQGFGTAIVLSVNLMELENLITHTEISEEILDPDYAIQVPGEILPFLSETATPNNYWITFSEDGRKSFFHRKEITCAYIFGEASALKGILGNFPLHP